MQYNYIHEYKLAAYFWIRFGSNPRVVFGYGIGSGRNKTRDGPSMGSKTPPPSPCSELLSPAAARREVSVLCGGEVLRRRGYGKGEEEEGGGCR